MRKIRYIKGNLRRGDFLRSVLTDTSPYEVPLIVSNDGFYKNLTNRATYSRENAQLIDKIIRNNNEKYTIPYRYTITKDTNTVRRLSLIHPSSQLEMAAFYKKYDSLICFFSSIGPFSIRHPEKIGSSFFFPTPISDANKYRNNKIDTTEIDKFVRNPASYFAYSGFDRLYKFYGSSGFVRLEKKYPLMILMDITKCFDSIYSHSVSWATKSAENAKKNISASSFGNDFDKLMQKSNYSETNGICIGPEISRIFAEIILQRVDLEILREAQKEEIIFGRDFECKRYVDDYILFCKSEAVQSKILAIVRHCLAQFNLHLNEQKFQYFTRPFLTPKSHIIHATKIRLTRLFESIVEVAGPNLLTPKRIFRTGSFVKSFISSIKSGCFEEGVSYDMVSNYVIASLARRIDRLVGDFESAIDAFPELRPQYVKVILIFLELVFFFYTVNPTVASSYNVSRALIISMRFIETQFSDDMKMVAEHVREWVNNFIFNSNTLKRLSPRSKIPIEVLNVLVSSFELGHRNSITEEWLLEHIIDVDHLEYFSIVSCLYYIKDRSEYSTLRAKIEKQIGKILNGCENVKRSAHDAYLALDILACPSASMTLRRQILTDLRKICGLSARSQLELDSDLLEFVQSPWFVQWDSVDIVNMIRKKELSAVY